MGWDGNESITQSIAAELDYESLGIRMESLYVLRTYTRSTGDAERGSGNRVVLFLYFYVYPKPSIFLLVRENNPEAGELLVCVSA